MTYLNGKASDLSIEPATGDIANATELLAKLERESRRRLETNLESNLEWFSQHFDSIIRDQFRFCPQTNVEITLIFVQWYFKEGYLGRARDLAAKATFISRREHLPSLLRRSLNLLGAVYCQCGRLSDASVSFVEALKVADDIGDRMGRAAVIGNLSVARFNAGLLAEAIALNRYVIELTAGEPHMSQLAAYAHHNIALSCLLLDDICTAFDEIKAATDLNIEIKNQFCMHQRVLTEVTFSRILVRLGRLEEARKRAELSDQYAREMGASPSKIQASLARILCDAADGEPLTALAQLESLRHLIGIDDPAYRDLLEIERQCQELAGNPESAEQSHERHLRTLAHFQRYAAIQQVAAFQRSISTWGSASEGDLVALPRGVRERLLNSWAAPQKREMVREQLEAIASLADQREDWSGEHSMRVGRLVHSLAANVGYTNKQAIAIGFAARLHDIGKIAVPDILLLKHGKLGPKELEVLRRHTVEGAQILADILLCMERHKPLASTEQLDALRLAAEIAHAHHEWWDGSGYPRGLSGTAIPEAARITALADAFDELTKVRPYKHACAVDEALNQMMMLSGKQFEPRLCLAFCNLIKGLQERHGRELEGFAPRDEELSPYQVANRVIDRIVEQAGGRGGPAAALEAATAPLAV